MTRNLTLPEINSFISGCFNVHPTECDDNGHTMTFAEINIDRDKFDEELQWFTHDRGIQINFDALKYSIEPMDDSPIEILVVEIPYDQHKNR